MCVGREVDEMFPTVLSTFYDPESFLKTSSLVSIPDFLCGIEPTARPLDLFSHLEFENIG